MPVPGVTYVCAYGRDELTAQPAAAMIGVHGNFLDMRHGADQPQITVADGPICIIDRDPQEICLGCGMQMFGLIGRQIVGVFKDARIVGGIGRAFY